MSLALAQEILGEYVARFLSGVEEQLQKAL